MGDRLTDLEYIMTTLQSINVYMTRQKAIYKEAFDVDINDGPLSMLVNSSIARLGSIIDEESQDG